MVNRESLYLSKGLSMENYANKSGDSAVTGFQIESNSMKVRFKDHHVYLYDIRHPGPEHLEKMKELARAGWGLNTYIESEVKNDFSSKVI